MRLKKIISEMKFKEDYAIENYEIEKMKVDYLENYLQTLKGDYKKIADNANSAKQMRMKIFI